MLNKQFNKKIKPELKKELGLKNTLAVPEVEKVVINMRVTEGKEDRGAFKAPVKELSKITGQKPKICRANQSISAFNLTKGSPIGLKVTLRGKRMYDFLEKLFHLVLPQVKDFRGLSEKKFDNFGNYNLTLRDQSVFTEINVDQIEKGRSLQITIVTDTDSVEESKKLLLSLGLPFSKEGENG